MPSLAKRFTIERIRTLLLLGGGALALAIVGFLAAGKWRQLRTFLDVPKRLGIDIKQQADGYTYTQSSKGRAIFTLHASRVIQLKDGHAELHDVTIDLFGQDGKRVDRITGGEFNYNPSTQIATATGQVEMLLTRPGNARTAHSGAQPLLPGPLGAAQAAAQARAEQLASAISNSSGSEIYVKTSGLTFDQKQGIASTTQRVDFTLQQGSGNSIGATYISDEGHLTLEHSVELNILRPDGVIVVHATHGEYLRDEQLCLLTVAQATYRNANATAGNAKINFRDDGSAEQLDATNGFTLITAAGAHLSAPIGNLSFSPDNHPRKGFMQGGVVMDFARNLAPSTAVTGQRIMHGTAPRANFVFTSAGDLHQAHLEQGVTFNSTEPGQVTLANKSKAIATLYRTWRSQVADIDFRTGQKKGSIEPSSLHGTGNAVLTSESRIASGTLADSTRLAADDILTLFGQQSALQHLTATGHASLDEHSLDAHNQPIHQETSSNRIEAAFSQQPGTRTAAIETAKSDGNVLITRESHAASGAAQTLKASAGRASYESVGEWLHLIESPRIDDGQTQLTAARIDISRTTGQLLAHQDVKATWQNTGATPQPGLSLMNTGSNSSNNPTHAIAAEAELVQQGSGASASQQMTLHGDANAPARLWQQANSVTAPSIVLNRQRQTLIAQGTAQSPVRTVLTSTPGKQTAGKDASGKPKQPTVLRVRSNSLHYSETLRLATFTPESGGNIQLDTGAATITANHAEAHLHPAGVRTPSSSQSGATSSQLDTLAAAGDIVITTPSRRATGEKLVYTSDDGQYVLTGSATQPPHITDALRGAITGTRIFFHDADDRVTVDGDGHRTTTDTQSPR